MLIYYLNDKQTDDMKVIVELYDNRPMSASVPKRVTCTVAEAQVPMKGIAATPQYAFTPLQLFNYLLLIHAYK